MWGRLTNEKRRELALQGNFFNENGKRYNRKYCKKLQEKGYYIDEYGYKRFLNSNKLVHRWVMKKELGRKLSPDEEIHHKNRNKLDNRPKNLQLLTHKQHRRKHLVSKILTGRK